MNVCPRITQEILMTRMPLMEVMAIGGTLVLKIFLVLRSKEKHKKNSQRGPEKKRRDALTTLDHTNKTAWQHAPLDLEEGGGGGRGKLTSKVIDGIDCLNQ